jgi:hypothetical protein
LLLLGLVDTHVALIIYQRVQSPVVDPDEGGVVPWQTNIAFGLFGGLGSTDPSMMS